MRPAVFLDRDGIVNEPASRSDGGPFESPLNPDVARLVPGAVDGAAALRAAGFALVVVSNQPAAAKKQCTLEALQAVHERIAALLREQGLTLDGWYYCYHHPEARDSDLRLRCSCRKPEPGLLHAAAAELDLDLTESWMIGDSDVDVAAGRRAGCRTVLVEHSQTDHRRGNEIPDLRVPDLASAWDAMQRHTRPRSHLAVDA